MAGTTSAVQIQRILVKAATEAAEEAKKAKTSANFPFAPDDVPSERTVQIIVNSAPPTDDSGAWSIATAEPSHIPLVLPVLAWLTQVTDGRRHALTNLEAQMIVRLSTAVRSFTPFDLWGLTLAYRQALASGEDTAWIDAGVALEAARLATDTEFAERAAQFAARFSAAFAPRRLEDSAQGEDDASQTPAS